MGGVFRKVSMDIINALKFGSNVGNQWNWIFFMVAVTIPNSFPYGGVANWIHHFHRQ